MKIFEGIKFFNDDIARMDTGGSASASSASDEAEFCFNGNLSYGWISDGEYEDGAGIFLQRDFSGAMYGDAMIIANHNLKDIHIKINGIPAVSADIKTARGFTVVSLPFREDILSIRIEGSKTLTPNEEKRIGEVMLLTTIGQFAHPQELKNDLAIAQDDIQLQNGKHFIFNSGKAWTFTLDVFALEQSDIDLVLKLRGLGLPFYMWPCGGNERQFTYKFDPYMFENIYKVAISGGAKPNVKDNLYWTALRDSFKLVEVE
jgi:hypothetical protein